MKLSFLTFFFYSALEISTSLWCGTYLIACGFKPEVGAFIVSLMFASVMIGRIVSGFFAIKFTDHRLIYAGIFIVAAGCLVLSLPLPLWMQPVCICLLGLGCAPVYPSLIHATPARFGEALSRCPLHSDSLPQNFQSIFGRFHFRFSSDCYFYACACWTMSRIKN